MSCFMGSIRDISPLPINPPCLPGQFSRSVGTDVISAPCEMSAAPLADNPDIHFRVIAPTSAKPLFNRLANVTFESGLSDDGLVKAYRESSCFLTMVENATATNALLEAMACGLPVIAERIGGIPEYVNENCASLVAHGDWDSAAREILQLSRSRDLQFAMGRAARRRAEELDWDRVAEQTRGVYESIGSGGIRFDH